MARFLSVLPGLIGAIVAYVAIQFTHVIGLSGELSELLIFLVVYLAITGVVQSGLGDRGRTRSN